MAGLKINMKANFHLSFTLAVTSRTLKKASLPRSEQCLISLKVRIRFKSCVTQIKVGMRFLSESMKEQLAVEVA